MLREKLSQALYILAVPLFWLMAGRWRFRLALVAGVIGCGAAAAYLVHKRDRGVERGLQASELRYNLDRAIDLDDAAVTETLLERLSRITPDDPVITARLRAIRRGEADSGDPALARLLMFDHLRHGRWPEAAREAAKAMTAEPGHMMIRAVLARQELVSGRPEAARAHLAAVPSPFDAPDRATPGALELAIRLKGELGEDDSDLLAFIATRLMPVVKTGQFEQFPPHARLQLLRCYHLASRALDRFPELSEYWVPGARALEQLGRDPALASDVALAREGHLEVAQRLRRAKALPEGETAALVAEFEAGVRATWAEAQARAPRNAMPYVGLALASRRAGDVEGARRWLDRGLREAADPRELYLEMGRLLGPGDPAGAVALLEQAHQRYPTDALIGRMLAELTLAAGRPDRARDLCRSARAERPDLAWACRLEAAACLQLGRPTQALEALAPLRPALPRDPAGLELYARAASAVGAEAMAQELLNRAPADAVEADAQVGAARGYLQAGRPDLAAASAARVNERFPDHLGARTVHAEALRLSAEAGDQPRWDTAAVRKALEAFEWLRRRDPDGRWVAQRMAWLQLKGLNSPQSALRAAEPLRRGGTLTPEAAETLGAVLAANGRAEEALRPLDAAVAAAPSAAGPRIARAAALLRSGRRDAARKDLEAALARPRTPRQAAECQNISQELKGEK